MKVELQPEARARSATELTVKLFADGADPAGMLALYQNPLILRSGKYASLMPLSERNRSRCARSLKWAAISA
jgi:hypothetical protein